MAASAVRAGVDCRASSEVPPQSSPCDSLSESTRAKVAQVKIVTDSSAYLPESASIAQLGIEVIPLIVRLGRQSYPERVNQTDETFMRRLTQDSKSVHRGVAQRSARCSRCSPGWARRPTASSASTASGALFDIGEVARKASSGFMGRQRIVVLDTQTTSAALGIIVEAAARAAAEGASQAEVVQDRARHDPAYVRNVLLRLARIPGGVGAPGPGPDAARARCWT